MPESKPLTKTQFFSEIAEETGKTKSEVAEIFDGFTTVLRKQIADDGPGSISIPGLIKVERVKKPARVAKKGVPNPFKPGETMDIAAKPAHNVIKVRALKGLKDMT